MFQILSKGPQKHNSILSNKSSHVHNANGGWCVVVVGDFNAIRKKRERKGRNNANVDEFTNESVEFNNFIDNMRLQNILLISQMFMWYKARGAKKRIDRIIVSQEWL